MIELREPTAEETILLYNLMVKERKLGLFFVEGKADLEIFQHLVSCESGWIANEFYGVFMDDELCGAVSLSDNDLHFCTFDVMSEDKVAGGREVIRQLFVSHPEYSEFTGVTPGIHVGALEYVKALGAINVGVIKDYFKTAYGRTRDGVMSVFRREDYMEG